MCTQANMGRKRARATLDLKRLTLTCDPRPPKTGGRDDALTLALWNRVAKR